ncbi:hypothetical protein NC651_030427 [Populus alba x Populus x berolinensis]|nr:hypothetical protein NC651_030427 [Populus alba x Populus x berolinensis]
MAKFNVVQKRRRAQISKSKRAIHGDPLTKKLKNKTQPLTLSGKRKLLKKWRSSEQKEAVDKGLVTMQDVELLFFEKVESLREGITLGNWQQQLNQVKMGHKGDEVWLIRGALEIKTGEDHARVVIHNPCCKVGGLFVLFDGEVRENQACNVGALSDSSS